MKLFIRKYQQFRCSNGEPVVAAMDDLTNFIHKYPYHLTRIGSMKTVLRLGFTNLYQTPSTIFG